MRITNRLAAACAAGLIALVGLTACGSSGSTTPTKQPAATGPIRGQTINVAIAYPAPRGSAGSSQPPATCRPRGHRHQPRWSRSRSIPLQVVPVDLDARLSGELREQALGSAPLILGVDLTGKITNAFGSSGGLTRADRRLLENRRVIAVDQDAIDASRIADKRHVQIFAKREPAGDAVVGLFNTDQSAGTRPELITTTASALGLPADSAGYRIVNLWSGATRVVSAKGTVRAEVPPEGVALLRVVAIAESH